MPGNLYTAAYAAFVGKMKELRVASGLTQAEVAERVGRPQSFISKSERMERRIDVVEFIAIMKAIGADPSAALEEIDSVIQAEGAD